MASEVTSLSEGAEKMEQERKAIAADILGYTDNEAAAAVDLIAQKKAHLLAHVEFVRAFADETRMDIISFLSYTGAPDWQLRSYTVSEIAERVRMLQKTDISLSTVSHHLQELKRIGIVKVERSGKERYYQLDLDHEIERVGSWYKRLLVKREMIRQRKPFCLADIEAMLNANKEAGQDNSLNHT